MSFSKLELRLLLDDVDLQSRELIGEIVIHSLESSDQEANLVKGASYCSFAIAAAA